MDYCKYLPDVEIAKDLVKFNVDYIDISTLSIYSEVVMIIIMVFYVWALLFILTIHETIITGLSG